ncbi:hypothetical protein GGR55DRAFT_203042 [Xylaria sp. FL0064]|nr:hypothetical protein GGR55DRAFT_203042 [Xylaria sp. FL0064]
MAAAVVLLLGAVDVSLVVDREVGGAQTDSSRDSRLLFDDDSDVVSWLTRRMIDDNCKASNDEVRVYRFVKEKEDATLSTRLCSRDSTQFN